ncbi:helix-turn-helix domain-containing protein [Haloflavibacter putidus]|uniref:Helix-turn-helix transcriptional regulator n=1 Tax=Haloflavibacter putidus TaxID=2576776 RepID=A0A507ZS32_9FLAO|nr:helix-turn-helix transcriptional regulator [Haloflavibacter putidus]TQD40179.1 helix-turn-helix transcriptional regulator [Haloflavibacter putidus]
MVNSKEFTKRLEKIMQYYDISAAAFADKINVGRSSISHLLSGRNKPSLDFVMKVIKTFPEVELYWLLNGKGNFPPDAASKNGTAEREKENQKVAPTPISSSAQLPSSIPTENKKQKEIQKIVIFYKDGSFDAFEN